jgi:hypothetical protein
MKISKEVYTLFIITFFSFLTTQSFATPIISFRHEEDTAGVLKVENINYSTQDLTEFIQSNSQLVTSVELRLNSFHDINLARINVIYNKHGDLIGIFIDKNREKNQKSNSVLGLIVDSSIKSESLKNQSLYPNKNLLQLVTSSKSLSYFYFNDPVQDLAYPSKQIDLHRQMLIPYYIDYSGISEPLSVSERYFFAKDEATGAMDYFKDYPLPTLIDHRLYNPKDAGNFTWAVGMRKLGFSYLEVKVGSEVNAFFNTREQNDDGSGIILMGDSQKDQTAIKYGFYSYFSTKVTDLESYQQMLMDIYIPRNPNVLPILSEASIAVEKFWLQWLSQNWKNIKVPLNEWNMMTLLKLSKAMDYMSVEDKYDTTKALLNTENVGVISLVHTIKFLFDNKEHLSNINDLLVKIIQNPQADRQLLESLEQKLLYHQDHIDGADILLDLIAKKLLEMPAYNPNELPVISL